MNQLNVTMNRKERIFGFFYLALQLLALPFILALCDWFFNLRLSDAELNFVFFAINFICVTIIFRRFIIQNAKIALQKIPSVLITAGAAYVLYIITSTIVTTCILLGYPAFYNVNNSYVSEMVENRYSLMFIGTVLLVPITEELLYRGLIFSNLYNKNRFLAFIVSTLAFAVLHVYGYIGTYPPLHLLCCLLQYLPAGIWLAWAYAKTNSILTPVLIHMFINYSAVLAMR